MKEVAAFSLNRLTDGFIDVDYAFLRLMEQVVAIFSDSQDGLNLVNSTNLSFFDSHQKAEIFRLKAFFFSKMNERPKSNQAVSDLAFFCI